MVNFLEGPSALIVEAVSTRRLSAVPCLTTSGRILRESLPFPLMTTASQRLFDSACSQTCDLQQSFRSPWDINEDHQDRM